MFPRFFQVWSRISRIFKCMFIFVIKMVSWNSGCIRCHCLFSNSSRVFPNSRRKNSRADAVFNLFSISYRDHYEFQWTWFGETSNSLILRNEEWTYGLESFFQLCLIQQKNSALIFRAFQIWDSSPK